MKDSAAKRRWRFCVTDFDDNDTYLDKEGGPDGEEADAVFIGDSMGAMAEGDRRANLWENKTGNIAARICRDSLGLVFSNTTGNRPAPEGETR